MLCANCNQSFAIILLAAAHGHAQTIVSRRFLGLESKDVLPWLLEAMMYCPALPTTLLWYRSASMIRRALIMVLATLVLLVAAASAAGDATGRHYDQRRALHEEGDSNVLSITSKIDGPDSAVNFVQRGVSHMLGTV